MATKPKRATYTVTVLRVGSKPAQRYFVGAPSDARMAAALHRHGWQLAIRYYPLKKGWMISDLRNARTKTLRSGKVVWTAIARVPKVFATHEAAFMYTHHVMLYPAKQEEMSFG